MCYQYVTHGPYCDMASATRIMQHATCACNNNLHKAQDMQRAMFTVTDATTCNDNIQPAQTSNLPHAPFDMQRATCDIRQRWRGARAHTHTHTQCNRSHARRRMDGAAIPSVWVSCRAWARRATRECGGAEAANKQTIVAVGPPRRMGDGNGTPLPGRHAEITRHSVAAVGARRCSQSTARRSACGRSGSVYRRPSERRL
jgi:hypothetical protein